MYTLKKCPTEQRDCNDLTLFEAGNEGLLMQISDDDLAALPTLEFKVREWVCGCGCGEVCLSPLCVFGVCVWADAYVGAWVWVWISTWIMIG
jgi:hypothetical protein